MRYLKIFSMHSNALKHFWEAFIIVITSFSNYVNNKITDKIIITNFDKLIKRIFPQYWLQFILRLAEDLQASLVCERQLSYLLDLALHLSWRYGIIAFWILDHDSTSSLRLIFPFFFFLVIVKLFLATQRLPITTRSQEH